MTEKSGLEGAYRSADRLKRQQEVLERVEAGTSAKRIATDLGLTEGEVQQIIERLRADGSLPQGSAGPDAG